MNRANALYHNKIILNLCVGILSVEEFVVNAETLSFEDLAEAKREIAKINVDPVGVEIMALKAIFKVIKIKGVDSKTANILKQEMLSRGGDAAVSKDVGSFEAKTTDVIIMGTLAQYIRLIKKLEHQQFGDCIKISEVIRDLLFKGHDINKAEVW